MNITSRRSNNSPQLGSSKPGGTPVYTTTWNDVPGDKYTVLLRITLLLSVVVFLQGYLTASSHFMVNHMDAVFRFNQGSSAIAYMKNRNIQDNEYHQQNFSSTVLSTSIITNFHYVYASDTYPQTTGSSSSRSSSSNSISRVSSQRFHQNEQDLFQTHQFSTFARGWIVLMLLGQAFGSALAWKFTDTLGR